MTTETALIAFATALVTSLIAVLAAERRFRREFRLQYKTQAVIYRLLRDPRYTFRTFNTLRHHIGGFEDDELRRCLVEAGALRFQDSQGTEIWSLLDRCSKLLDAEYNTETN